MLEFPPSRITLIVDWLVLLYQSAVSELGEKVPNSDLRQQGQSKMINSTCTNSTGDLYSCATLFHWCLNSARVFMVASDCKLPWIVAVGLKLSCAELILLKNLLSTKKLNVASAHFKCAYKISEVSVMNFSL